MQTRSYVPRSHDWQFEWLWFLDASYQQQPTRGVADFRVLVDPAGWLKLLLLWFTWWYYVLWYIWVRSVHCFFYTHAPNRQCRNLDEQAEIIGIWFGREIIVFCMDVCFLLCVYPPTTVGPEYLATDKRARELCPFAAACFRDKLLAWQSKTGSLPLFILLCWMPITWITSQMNS